MWLLCSCWKSCGAGQPTSTSNIKLKFLWTKHWLPGHTPCVRFQHQVELYTPHVLSRGRCNVWVAIKEVCHESICMLVKVWVDKRTSTVVISVTIGYWEQHIQFCWDSESWEPRGSAPGKLSVHASKLYDYNYSSSTSLLNCLVNSSFKRGWDLGLYDLTVQ